MYEHEAAQRNRDQEHDSWEWRKAIRPANLGWLKPEGCRLREKEQSNDRKEFRFRSFPHFTIGVNFEQERHDLTTDRQRVSTVES